MTQRRQGWIGVDLDGTLACEEHGGAEHIGTPIIAMVERVKRWIADGRTVKIMTARVSGEWKRPGKTNFTIEDSRRLVEDWTEKVLGTRLEVVCCKDFMMYAQYDDRAVQVIRNTGVTVEEELEATRNELKEVKEQLQHMVQQKAIVVT